ncbi:MAG TPA: DinB family protein [Thermoanaerobaculia bacterium]|nr:DinB family protein [Thermoanaerobaculia bacterium]
MPSSAPAASLPLDSHLARLAAEVAEITAETEALCAGLSPAQLSWRPAPNRWGVADCFIHLAQAAEVFHPRFVSAIERTVAAGAKSRGAWKGTWTGRLFRAISGSKVRIPLPAPPALRVVADAPPDAHRRFLAREAELLEILHRADGLDLGFSTTGSPISRRLRIPLGDGLALVVGHARRHLEQARRVTLSPKFPRS